MTRTARWTAVSIVAVPMNLRDAAYDVGVAAGAAAAAAASFFSHDVGDVFGAGKIRTWRFIEEKPCSSDVE